MQLLDGQRHAGECNPAGRDPLRTQNRIGASAESGYCVPVKTGIEQIRAGQLQVDPTVQRGFNRAKAEKIRDHWDEDAVGVLTISRRGDGSMWVMEGQHRLWGGRESQGKDYRFNCEVHVGLSLQEEAAMFIKLNTLRSLPTPFDRFRISLEAGYEEEVAIAETLAELDLKIGPSARSTTVGALTAIKRIYADNGTIGLYNTLAIAINAWGRKTDTWDADILQAIAQLLLKKPDLDAERLGKKLQKKGRSLLSPEDWKRQGQALAKAGGSTSRSRSIARLMAESYDTGLSEDKKIHF